MSNKENTKTLNEKTADEMFEEENYKKTEYSNCFWYEGDRKVRITFWNKTKTITIMGDITINILQAINKKVEELRWKNL